MKQRRVKETFLAIFLDDEKRAQKQLFFLEIILGVISLVMSLINIATHKELLLMSTTLMSVFSFANAHIINMSVKNKQLGHAIFAVKMFLLYTYFIIYGGTEGFSAIWLLMLPACGMFAFGRKNGAILSTILLAELVILFYTPLRGIVIQYQYTDSFFMRFPVLYSCFFVVGYFLEYVRELTYSEMNNLREEAREQSRHDALTGLYNRFGFDRFINSYILNVDKKQPFALLIIDADAFKDINDKYGHDFGDKVLKEIADRIGGVVEGKGMAFRWGGDEFAVLIDSGSYRSWREIAEEIRTTASQSLKKDDETIEITISIGGVGSGEVYDVTARNMLIRADKRLYRAKVEGRNRCVCR